MRIEKFVALGLLALCVATSAQAASNLPANFTDNAVTTGLGAATSMAWAPDGSNRLFITVKTGPIRVYDLDTGTHSVWATLSPYTGSECGVLSVCFDPNFSTNRRVYVFYTASSSEQRIVRFIDNPTANTGALDSALSGPGTLVGGLPTVGNNHDGGSIGIGPDHNGLGNYLYWSIGDLGNGTGVDLNLTSLASKLGRANLDGTAPNDNPFYNSADGIGPTDYIWACGLRNPFTFTFHPVSKKIWMNVVGTSYEQVFVIGRKDTCGYNDYEVNQPSGMDANGSTYIRSKIEYSTGSSSNRTISTASRTSNVATFTFGSAHNIRQGEKVTVAGVADASFNGTFYVASVPASPADGSGRPTTLTISQTAANATSSGGTVTNADWGNCITGGCFYDGTAFPASHQGNFFFGDYGSGMMMRATLDASHNVTSVDLFSDGNGSMIDMAVGPDGWLYYVNHGGTLRRIQYSSATQDIVVSTGSLTVGEGSSGTFTVRLAVAPATNVTVNLARSSGDTDITVSPATMTFTPTDWNTPKTATVSAAEDVDTANDSAVISMTSTGLTTKTVNATGTDNDTMSLVLSTNSLTVNEGSSGSVTVRLSNMPTSNVTVTVAMAGGSDASLSAAPATLTFTTANWNTNQTVTVTAAEDADLTSDSGTVNLTSPATATRTVTISTPDNDAAAPVITSTADTSGVQGAPYSYDVNATGSPTPTYSLTTMPAGMTINATSGVISWTPAATGTFNVTVQAANGVPPNATQSYAITVNPDASPIASITAPLNNATVSGATSEFYGDGSDDVGTTQAEFIIDGVVRYTDVNTGGHYHIGGSHALFNTTTLANGVHTLSMRVTDTKGQAGTMTISVTANNAGSNQSLTVSTAALSANEGASSTFTVRLSHQPASNVTVNIARTAGDTDVTVSGGATRTFTPANYATPQTVTIAAAEDADLANDSATISITSTGLTTRTVAVTAADNDIPNQPPAITSISFAPAAPKVGELVTFTVAASDPEVATLTLLYDYKDGASDSTGKHTYLAAGTYSVGVTVSDGVNSVTGSVIVVVAENSGGGGSGGGGSGGGGGGGTPPVFPLAGVDTDGDGVSDLDEIADGTNPLDPKSVKKIAMSLQKASGKASFVSGGKDSCTVSGTLPDLPALFDPSGKALTLDVGGAKVAFTLDARGKGRSNNGSIALVLKPSVRNKTTRQLEFQGGPVAFKAQLKNGTWAPNWADEGMNPAVTETGTITMVIDVLLNGKVYTTTADVSYSSKAGVSAKFKD